MKSAICLFIYIIWSYCYNHNIVFYYLIYDCEIIFCRKYNRKSLEQKYGGNLNDLFKDDTSFKKFLNS